MTMNNGELLSCFLKRLKFQELSSYTVMSHYI